MALPLSYNLRNLRVRWQVTLLSVAGIALVVAVFIAVLAMATGFRTTLRATGRTDNAIITQKGSQSELTSGIPLEQANVIMVDSRVARDAAGPLASPEVVVVTNLPRRDDGEPTSVLTRGVTPRAFDVRGGIHLTQGRRFTSGLREIIVGRGIQTRVRGLELGAKVKMQGQTWDVVGVFAADGSGFESEIWGDLDVLTAAFKRSGYYETVVVRLADPATRAAFADELDKNPQMKVDLKGERRYYDEQSGSVVAALIGLAAFVSLVMGVGAVFAAMNTMYGIVAGRSREIGTLRALGFSRIGILFSFMVESLLLALVGGVLGCLVALPAHGMTGATVSNFSEIAFAFRITPTMMAGAIVFALLMGFWGGVLPALRAARLPITTALREA
jgi:putative ABC transport system permease protein